MVTDSSRVLQIFLSVLTLGSVRKDLCTLRQCVTLRVDTSRRLQLIWRAFINENELVLSAHILFTLLKLGGQIIILLIICR